LLLMKKYSLIQISKPFFFTLVTFLFAIRLLEIATTQSLYGFSTQYFLHEILGLGLDLLYACLFSLIITPFIWLFRKLSIKIALFFAGFILITAIVIHI